MGFKDFIIDSIKYSVQEKTTFLVFGLLLIALAFLPVNDVMSMDPSIFMNMGPSNLIIFLPIALVTLILLAIQAGYLSKVLMDLVNDINVIPKFRDISFYIKEGIKDIVLGIYYMIIPIAIIMLVPESLGDLWLITMLIAMVLLYLLLLMVQTAVLYSIIENYKKTFNMIYIFKKSKEIGFKRLNFVLILSLIIAVIISFVVVTNKDPIMTIIFIIIGFILYPILAIMDARYLGLIGKEILDKKYEKENG